MTSSAASCAYRVSRKHGFFCYGGALLRMKGHISKIKYNVQ